MLRMTSVILSVYGWDWATRTCALAIREVAISSMARVIFIVDCTLLIRRRICRTSADATVGYALALEVGASSP